MAEDQQKPGVEQEVAETVTLENPAEVEVGDTNVESVSSEEAPENKIENSETTEVEAESVTSHVSEENSNADVENTSDSEAETVAGTVSEEEVTESPASENIGAEDASTQEEAPSGEEATEEVSSLDTVQEIDSEVVEAASQDGAETAPEAEIIAESESEPTDSEDSAGEDVDEKSDDVSSEESAAVKEQYVSPVFPEGMIGYTGKITGNIVKLEDVDQTYDPDEDTLDLDKLRELIESTLTNVSEHEIVSGKIVSIGEKDVVIDIGFKSDGIVSRSEFEDELAVGDEIEVYLERIEDYHGQLVLSKTKADTVRRWRRIESAYENEEVLEGTIVRRIKGGMIVELFEGLEAFLPGSQIDVRPVRDFDAYLEKRMEFKIVKLNPINENIVVSHKALIEKDLQAQRQTILSTMEPGQILEGAVKNITDFGVFIDLGGVDGLLHITDLSWGRVSHPSELVSLDEQLNVVVLDYDKERQRISLGLKQLQPHPWESIEEKYKTENLVGGKVVSITDYGAFVELEKGIEGLVHISEMSWTEHIRHPSQMVSLGQLVEVKILNIDTEGKKISLGMKQLEPDPWENIAGRYPPGTVMRGKVRNITNFGVFVEIEPGIDGLVHISDLSWTKRIRHPSEMVKKGLELDVVVLNIDTSERRISLGHKQVDTNPWSKFAQVYAEGERSEATVVRHEDKGIVVELPLEVEAFIPHGELRNPSQVSAGYPLGHKLEDLLVIRFAPGQKEIILSEVASEIAKEREEKRAEQREKREVRQKEQQEIRKFRQKESAASGPTTLGELSGLADLKAKLEAEESQAAASPEATDTAPAEPEVPAEGAPVDAEATVEPEAEVEVTAEPEAEVEAPAETEVDSPAEADGEVAADASPETGSTESESPEAEEAVAEEKPKKATRKKAAPKAASKGTKKATSKTASKDTTKAASKAKPKKASAKKEESDNKDDDA